MMQKIKHIPPPGIIFWRERVMWMEKGLILCAGKTRASGYALTYLQRLGLPVTDTPSDCVRHVLLDVPSFESSGNLRLGGAVENLLAQLPKDVVIYGGNLNHQGLAGYRTVDFLQDADYLAQNAYITAECALDVALPDLTVTLRGCPVLVIGWGRIGKCLAQLLKCMGADVTVAARKEADLAMLSALGYHEIAVSQLGTSLEQYRLIFNTAPAPVLSRKQMAHCREDCVRIELASTKGMDSDDVILARGLPGIHLPESSGELIARTFLKFYQEAKL